MSLRYRQLQLDTALFSQGKENSIYVLYLRKYTLLTL